jgi:UDPglucose 6-dehydrogenase
LSVVGTGYLGATHAVCLASLGYDVVGVDVSSEKIARLASGEVPFFEPGLESLLRKTLEGGRLRFSADLSEVADCDVHFVCVGTPQKEGEYAADLTFVDSAFRALVGHARPGSLLVGKSTVPAGTAARLRAELPDHLGLAWNPEFLREGFAVEDTLRPDRLVFGVSGPEGEAALRAAYAPLIAQGTPVVVTDFATAELVKVAANAFLATKISFINAMAEVCEVVHADVTTLSEALSYDPRIGGRFLRPGLGFGGGCLPKDIRAFMARAGELGVDQALSFLREVDAINQRRRARTVDLAAQLLDGLLAGRKIAALGAAFKPDSDDIRDSPALEVAAALHRHGARVSVYDPEAMENARRDYPQLHYTDSVDAACRGAELVLHLTEWEQFRQIDPEALASVVAETRVLDGRNALDPVRWRAAGWVYRALGRP